jgi:hypothetical protein
MIHRYNCPTYSGTPSSYSVTHVDLKRSLVINSHYQELKFNYRTFKFEHDHVCISQLRTFFRKLIFEKKMLAVLFLFWESIVEILLKVTLNTKNPIKKNPIPHSWLIAGFVTRLTRRMPLGERKLLTLLDHMNSPPVFSGVRVIRSLVLCVCFVDRCLYFFSWPLYCLFVIDIRILITPLISSNSSHWCCFVKSDRYFLCVVSCNWYVRFS